MNPSQRKRHLAMWAVVLPLAALMIVLGWFGRTEPPVQEALDVPQLPAASSPDGEAAS